MSAPKTLFIFPADPKVYPFTRSPLAKTEGGTLLQTAVAEYRAAGVAPADMLCAGSDEEALLCASRLGIRTHQTADPQSDFFGLKESEALKPYGTLVLCSLQFPFFDKAAIVETVARHDLSGRLLIVQASSFPAVLPVGALERIAEVWHRPHDGLLHPFGQTVVPLKTPWSVRSIKDLRALEILRTRKRIVFHTEAYTSIGMGHLYRSLSIAAHLQNFDVRFICSDRSPVVSAMASGWSLPVTVCKGAVTPADILKLRPTLVINDVLNTTAAFMTPLTAACKVVNFEDLGDGAALAHATINDLYEDPVATVANGYWGHEYYFLREEFEAALPRPCPDRVKEVLLTFGGTDPNDLTRKTLRTVAPLCRDNTIKINLVTGSGYGRLAELQTELEALAGAAEVAHIHRTGIMSSIMERSDLAICSNGRTTYELSHMHIPAIVICHHEREAMHGFAREENGFVNLGVFNGKKTLEALNDTFARVIADSAYRTGLYRRMATTDFRQNRQRVLEIITRLVEEK